MICKTLEMFFFCTIIICCCNNVPVEDVWIDDEMAFCLFDCDPKMPSEFPTDM